MTWKAIAVPALAAYGLYRLFVELQYGMPLPEKLGLRKLRERAVADLTGDVLELGAGTGLNIAYYRSADTVVAIEPDDDAREFALEECREARVPVTIIDAWAEQLPFEDSTFDAAVVSMVLCTVEDVQQTLGELQRVLRPGAPVHLIEHVLAPYPPLAALQRAYTPLLLRLGSCHPDRKTVPELMAAGFVIKECRPHVLGTLLEIRAQAP